MRKTSSKYNEVIAEYVATGALVVEDGGRHAKAVNPVSRDWIPIAGSPSDCRGVKNFRASVRRLVARGEGVIHARQVH